MLKVKNNEQNEFEFEKELRNKMKELSDSVDCIEKINQRVFNSKDVPFFEEILSQCPYSDPGLSDTACPGLLWKSQSWHFQTGNYDSC